MTAEVEKQARELVAFKLETLHQLLQVSSAENETDVTLLAQRYAVHIDKANTSGLITRDAYGHYDRLGAAVHDGRLDHVCTTF